MGTGYVRHAGLVQDAVLKTLRQLHDFEPAGPGALQAVSRRAVMIASATSSAARAAAGAARPRDDMASGATYPSKARSGRRRWRGTTPPLHTRRRESGAITARLEWGFPTRSSRQSSTRPTAAAAGWRCDGRDQGCGFDAAARSRSEGGIAGARYPWSESLVERAERRGCRRRRRRLARGRVECRRGCRS